ncbi:hypothetical protein SB781_35915, partial [Paraburkholderia sp. SIMBA_061]
MGEEMNGPLTIGKLRKIFDEMGPEADNFKICLQDKQSEVQEIQKDVVLGQDGLPTFIVIIR